MSENIQIKETETKGKIIFANRDFEKDEVVFVVCGPIVNKPSIYTIPIDKGLFIDPLCGAGKELCHSCEPNCGIKNRTQVVAMREINEGEEINIDYAMIVPHYSSEMTEENRVCRCGCSNCRGKLGAFCELSEELKEKYKGYISEFLL